MHKRKKPMNKATVKPWDHEINGSKIKLWDIQRFKILKVKYTINQWFGLLWYNMQNILNIKWSRSPEVQLNRYTKRMCKSCWLFCISITKHLISTGTWSIETTISNYPNPISVFKNNDRKKLLQETDFKQMPMQTNQTCVIQIGIAWLPLLLPMEGIKPNLVVI